MDDKVLISFIGVGGTVIGVLLGWILQRMAASTARLAEHRALVAYSEKLVRQVLVIVDECFSSYESLLVVTGPPYKTVFPKHLQEELSELQKWSRRLDPDLAVYMMYLNQAVQNLNQSLLTLHDEVKNREEKNLNLISSENISLLVVIRAARKTKEYSYCVWYLCLKKSSIFSRVKAKFCNKYKELRVVYRRHEDEYSYNGPIESIS